MKYYPDIERIAAEKLDEICDVLFDNIEKWDEYVIELNKIYSQIPNEYKNEFEENGTTYIKFWDNNEFAYFLDHEQSNKEVVWLLNAYPKCCYFLAVIQIERGLFKEAKNTLIKGIELEPDNPILLNEIGLLYGKVGVMYKDNNIIESALSYYNEAFDSRYYNSPKDKARSLRGMGFSFFDLGNFDKAEEMYMASLTWEENVIARKELENIIRMKSKGESIIVTESSNINKIKNAYSYEFFCEQKNKLQEDIRSQIPNSYVYIWTKAAIFHTKGIDTFKNEDHFHYPLDNWNIDQIEFGVSQMINFLRGITPEYYIILNTIEDVKDLLLTFHFSLINEKVVKNNLNESILKADFKHIMDNSTIQLFFKLNHYNKKNLFKFWS